MASEPQINTFVIDALSEKFMAGSGFFYGVIGETLHISLNRGDNKENYLLQHGLAFVVEEGTSQAKSLEEV